MGDPAGIGPELCLQLLRDERLTSLCIPVVVGNAGVLARVAAQLQWPTVPRILPAQQWPDVWRTIAQATVIDVPSLPAAAVEPGVVSAACGRAAYDFILWAIDEALADRVDAIATGPIHKEALHAAGIPFPGHTEILAHRTGSQQWCMMLTSPTITCSLVTAHVGYREVPELLSVERILTTIELTADALHRIRGRQPRLLVCGLNPHAGEHGLFGQGEEERFIAPAIAAARAEGIDVQGPLPPDTAFLPKYRTQCDAYVCMYHDQGLIPLKTLAFDEAVNVTLGLPIIRTSVDHGTAFDIAWKGRADVSSFVHAVQLAARLAASGD